MKKILIIAGAILLIAGAAAGGFWGGMQVTVTGQRDSNGDISASRVMILSENSDSATGVPAPPEPTAVGTEQ